MLLVGAFLVVGAVAPAAANTELLVESVWPMYGHDPKHTFRSTLEGPTDDNLLLPTTDVGNIIYSQAAVTLDGVFIFGVGFSTVGIRADGKEVWRTRVGAEASFSSPTLDTDEFLYIGGRDNQLWKKDTADGSEVCKRYVPVDGDIKDGPTISAKYKDRVYVATGVNVYAISTRQTTVNGSSVAPCTLIWKSPPLAATVFSSVSLADSVPGNGDSMGKLVVAAGTYVYLIKDNGGAAKIVAKGKTGSVSGPTPLIHPVSGNIYVGSLNNKFYGFKPGPVGKSCGTDPSDCSLVPLPGFPVDLGSKIWSSAALSADGTKLYVPTDNGRLYAVDANSGQKTILSQPAGNRFTLKGYAPVVDGAGNIYIIGQDKYVRALRSDGKVLWAKQIGAKAAPPTIVHGGLIVLSQDHKVYRFCRPPTGPVTAQVVCGFTIDTTQP